MLAIMHLFNLHKIYFNFLRSVGLLGLLSLITACTSLTPLRNPVPPAEFEKARISEIERIRFWGDQLDMDPTPQMQAARRKMLATYETLGRPAQGLQTNFLAISGGAWDGAYGAGLLSGWTKCGNRPDFDMVTGISTGALLAPFAFLGSDYDQQMSDAFTSQTEESILSFTPLRTLFGALSLANSSPLADTIEKFATAEMLEAIGRERQKGRALFIGTTNLDAQRPVIWDIGRLANSAIPHKLELFRKIILASASIPGAFPPVLFDVTIDGKTYQELHVDGGVAHSVFSLPFQLDTSLLHDLGFPHKMSLYIIQNNKLEPERKNVELGLGKIVSRSLSSIIRSQSHGDLYRLYLTAQKQKLDFRLASIPAIFESRAEPGFSKTYMNDLLQFGYQQMLSGFDWHSQPPGLSYRGQSVMTSMACPNMLIQAEPDPSAGLTIVKAADKQSAAPSLPSDPPIYGLSQTPPIQ